jgi:chromate reductase
MNKPIRILGIAGSLRQASYNRGALRAAAELVPEGAELEIFDLEGIPGFNQDEEQNPPEKVAELKRRIRESDAILFVTPEYNYSVPGVLKNAIDWASRPYGDSAWNGKPAAIMGASIGAIATARAQYHLRQMMVFLNMFPINQQSARSNDRKRKPEIRRAGKSDRRSNQRLHPQVAGESRTVDAPNQRPAKNGAVTIKAPVLLQAEDCKKLYDRICPR